MITNKKALWVIQERGDAAGAEVEGLSCPQVAGPLSVDAQAGLTIDVLASLRRVRLDHEAGMCHTSLVPKSPAAAVAQRHV